MEYSRRSSVRNSMLRDSIIQKESHIGLNPNIGRNSAYESRMEHSEPKHGNLNKNAYDSRGHSEPRNGMPISQSHQQNVQNRVELGTGGMLTSEPGLRPRMGLGNPMVKGSDRKEIPKPEMQKDVWGGVQGLNKDSYGKSMQPGGFDQSGNKNLSELTFQGMKDSHNDSGSGRNIRGTSNKGGKDLSMSMGGNSFGGGENGFNSIAGKPIESKMEILAKTNVDKFGVNKADSGFNRF